MAKRIQHFTYDSDSTIVRRPTYVIEVLLSISAFLFGAYVSSPIFRTQVMDPQPHSFAGAVWIRVLVACIFFFLPAAISFLSMFSWKLRSNVWRGRATLAQFSGWFFIALLQLITVGFYPVSWLFSLTLAAVAAVCHLSTRVAIEDGR